MRAIRSITFVGIMLIMSSLAQARETALIKLDNNPILGSGAKELTLQAIEEAIRTAGASPNPPWTATANSPGSIRLSIIVRNKHTVVVDVIFDTKTYSIRYVSSINMNYEMRAGNEVIHPNYNKWVQTLKRAIDAELQKQ